MISRRLEFHNILVEILGAGNVYFQPPATLKIQYPCIIYSRTQQALIKADDKLYHGRTAYMVTVIDPNPDSNIHNRIAELPLCRYSKFYTQDNLNHDVYIIYF